jgi:hypothetical protein
MEICCKISNQMIWCLQLDLFCMLGSIPYNWEHVAEVLTLESRIARISRMFSSWNSIRPTMVTMAPFVDDLTISYRWNILLLYINMVVFHRHVRLPKMFTHWKSAGSSSGSARFRLPAITRTDLGMAELEAKGASRKHPKYIERSELYFHGSWWLINHLVW